MDQQNILDMPDDRRWLFLDDVFISNSISAAFGRNKNYKKPKPEDAAFHVGRVLKDELHKLAACYYGPEEQSPVGPEEHIQKIAALVEAIKRSSCAVYLEDGGLRFGVAHKALNVYLKFLWCERRIPMPPHCPFDRTMLLETLTLPRDCNGDWTKGTEDDYCKWITAAKVAAGDEPLARWELNLYTPLSVTLEQTA